MRKITLRILAVLAVLALVASACGAEDTSEADAAAAAQAAAEAEAEAAAAAQAAAEAEAAAAQAAAAEAEAMAAEAAADAEAALADAQAELEAVMEAAAAGDEEAQAALAEAEAAAEEAAMALEEAEMAADEAAKAAEQAAMDAEATIAAAEAAARTNLAQEGHPCIPPSTADQTARGTVVFAFGSIGDQNWLGPTAPFQSQATVMPMYEYLLCRDYQTGDVVQGSGQLAETWSHNENFTQFTFGLRKGVQFHDGWGELTSADVKFSFELAALEDSRNPNRPDFAPYDPAEDTGYVVSIETPDDYTVILNLEKPNPNIPNFLNEVIPAMPIVSKKYVDTVGRDEASFRPIGTGPFEFHSHELDVSVAFEAVDNHWRVTPGIEIIEVRVVNEQATMAAMMDAGEAQMAPTTFDDIPRLDADPDLKVVSLSGVRFPSVYLPGQYLNPKYDPEKTPPWATDDDESNIKVRQALSLAIDRQEIIDFLFGGRGTTEGACVQSFWPTTAGYNPDCEVDSYDPDAAKALLAEAGYPDPSQMVIPVDFAEHPQLTYTGAVMQAVAQQWQASLGVQIEASQTDFRTYQALSGNEGAYAAFVYSAPFFSTPCVLLGYYTRTDDFFSYTGESEELNDLVNTCVQQIFPNDLAEAEGAVFDYIYDRMLGIPIGYVDSVLAFADNLDWIGLPAPWNPYMTRYEYLRYTS
ncbi:MAG: ABC transporter substrate-binding protein [bacterium]|nr:ABC transporter substrate-binding protein [bacterium]